MPSFTRQAEDIELEGPVVEVKLAVSVIDEEVLRQGGQPVPSPVIARALIDTGASQTVVREQIINKLNLNPVGSILVNTPSCARVEYYEYFVRLLLPGSIVIETTVIAAPMKGQPLGCLIGRDVLREGVFIYMGHSGSFTFSL